MLLSLLAPRLEWHGIGDHSTGNSTTIPPSGSAVGSITETGRAGVGLALRWRRHHLRWRSAGVEATGGADRNRAPVRRVLHRLPQGRSDRAPVVGSDHAACIRTRAGL